VKVRIVKTRNDRATLQVDLLRARSGVSGYLLIAAGGEDFAILDGKRSHEGSLVVLSGDLAVEKNCVRANRTIRLSSHRRLPRRLTKQADQPSAARSQAVSLALLTIDS
jgi:hypothetical protein